MHKKRKSIKTVVGVMLVMFIAAVIIVIVSLNKPNKDDVDVNMGNNIGKTAVGDVHNDDSGTTNTEVLETTEDVATDSNAYPGSSGQIEEFTTEATTEATIEATTEEVTTEEVTTEATTEYVEEPTTEVAYTYEGTKLSTVIGRNHFNGHDETFYNLDMSLVVEYMREAGFSEDEYPYWVREDGCKMLGDYIIIASNLERYSKGTLRETSLGMGIVCDTGTFAKTKPEDVDIATTW